MKRLTKAQRAALELAIESGGEIEIGGIDGQPVRRDVVNRLYLPGYLKFHAGSHSLCGDTYLITAQGKCALETT